MPLRPIHHWIINQSLIYLKSSMNEELKRIAATYLGIYELDADGYEYPKANNLGNIRAALQAAFDAGRAEPKLS
jgi:hypothetical protein